PPPTSPTLFPYPTLFRSWTHEQAQLVPSLLLLAAASSLLLWLNARMHGNLAYAAAALWGLVAMWVRQSGSPLPGSSVTAGSALAVATLLVVQTAWLRMRARRLAAAGHVG